MIGTDAGVWGPILMRPTELSLMGGELVCRGRGGAFGYREEHNVLVWVIGWDN